jgi:hypothetical protein
MKWKVLVKANVPGVGHVFLVRWPSDASMRTRPGRLPDGRLGG